MIPYKEVIMPKFTKKDIDTVGELRRALKEFPDDYPIKIVFNSEICFIKGVADYDDACEIEMI